MKIGEAIKTLGLGIKFIGASKIERILTIKDAEPETLSELCWNIIDGGVATSMCYWAIEGKPEITYLAHLNSPVAKNKEKQWIE